MKRIVAPLLTVIVLVAAAVATLSYLSGEAPHSKLTLAEIEGQVKVTGGDGEAEPADPGRVLDPMDHVATGQASRAVLRLGDAAKSEIRIGPESSVQVRGQDEQTVTLELEAGRAQVTVHPGSSAVRMGNQGRQVLTTDGSFDMGLGDDGTLVVEMTEGSALTSGFEGVPPSLEAGERATVDSEGSTVVTPISEQLLLAVQWPDQARMREDTTLVVGSTVPNAKVRVEGGAHPVEVRADSAGRFEAHVPLDEGRNDSKVLAVDALGKVAMVDGWTAEVDSHGPTFRGGVEYTRGPEPR